MGRRVFVRVLPRQLLSGGSHRPAARYLGRPHASRKLPRRAIHPRLANAGRSATRRDRLARRRWSAAQTMTAVAVAILSMIVMGLAVALAVDRSLRGPLLLGLAFLYGSGFVFLAMLVMAILHIRWTIVTITIVVALSLCALALIAFRQPTTDNRQ